MWKTGHSLIKSKMKETGAPLAGEMSGHIFFKHRWYGFDDALYAAVRLIEAVGESGKSLTQLMDEMPPSSPPRSCASRSMKAASSRWSRRFSSGSAEGADVNPTDGARVNTARRLVASAGVEHPGRARRPRRSE
jgi:phosphomannomutase